MDKEQLMDLCLFRIGHSNYRPSGSEYVVRCPNRSNHKNGDDNFSCSFGYGNKQALVCNCPLCGDVRKEMQAVYGIPAEAFQPYDSLQRNNPDSWLEAAIKYYEQRKKLQLVDKYSYDYGQFSDGLHKIRFWDPEKQRKTFIWVRPDSTKKGGWSADRGELAHRLYVRGNLQNAETVYFFEGEKDVDNYFRVAGGTACSTENGAGTGRAGKKWLPEYTEQLKGRTVYLIPDHDEPGRKFMEMIGHELAEVCKVYTLDLATVWPEIPEKGDFSDYLQAVGADAAKEGLQKLIDSVAIKGDPGQIPERLQLVSMDAVQETECKWLIPGYIPLGALSVIGGDGGVGKSSLICSVVASVSTGEPCEFFYNVLNDFPDEIEPGTVLFLSGEDDLGIILKKRLRLAGANLKNIYSMQLGDERFQNLKIGTEFFKSVVMTYKPKLLIIDPLQAFLQADVRMESRNMMRDVLATVAGFCERLGMTTIVIAHSNKGAENSGRRRLADSADLWDCARSVCLVGRTDQKGVQYLSHEKSNYGALQETVLYKMDKNGKPVFVGTTDKKDSDFVSLSRKKASPKQDDAAEKIMQYLDDGQPKSINEMDDYLIADGFAAHTVRRAKADLKANGQVKMFCTGYGAEKKWFIERK